MKLKKLGKNTFVLNDATNIGIFLYETNNVVIIDTGFSKETGKNIVNICKENNWNIKMIISTHCHADHVGGNNYIQKLLSIPIYANKMERILIENPILLSTIAYGGYSNKELQNSFLMANPSKTKQISNKILPSGLSFFKLPGHCQDMIGIKTNDDVYFLSDSLIGDKILKSMKVLFAFNVEQTIETLNNLKSLEGGFFVPGHGEIYENIQELIKNNLNNINDLILLIQSICKYPQTFDKIIKKIFDIYHINMTTTQYNTIATTIRCYLSYMIDNNLIKPKIENNYLMWEVK